MSWRNECTRLSWSINTVSSVLSPPADSCGGKQRSACRKTVWRAAATSFTLFRLQEWPQRYAADKSYPVNQSLWSDQRHSTALRPGRTTKHSFSSWPTWTPGTNGQKRSTRRSVLMVQRKQFSGTLTRTKDRTSKSWLKCLINELGHIAERRCTVFP